MPYLMMVMVELAASRAMGVLGGLPIRLGRPTTLEVE